MKKLSLFATLSFLTFGTAFVPTFFLTSCSQKKVNSYDFGDFKNGNSILDYSITFAKDISSHIPNGVKSIFLMPSNRQIGINFADSYGVLSTDDVYDKKHLPLALVITKNPDPDDKVINFNIEVGYPNDVSFAGDDLEVMPGDTIKMPYHADYLKVYDEYSSVNFYAVNNNNTVSLINDYTPYKGLMTFTKISADRTKNIIKGTDYRSGMDLSGATLHCDFENLNWSSLKPDVKYFISGKDNIINQFSWYNSIFPRFSNSLVFDTSNQTIDFIDNDSHSIDVKHQNEIQLPKYTSINNTYFASVEYGADGEISSTELWNSYERDYAGSTYDPGFDEILSHIQQIDLNTNSQYDCNTTIAYAPSFEADGTPIGIQTMSVNTSSYSSFTQLSNIQPLSSIIGLDSDEGFSSVSSISTTDLEGFTHLQDLNFPRNTLVVGDDLLSSNSTIVNVSFSNSPKISSIGNNVLTDCTSLICPFDQDETMVLENLKDLKTIGDNFLSGCAQITKVDYSGCDSLSSVGDNWMSGCTSLSSVYFTGCDSLSSVGQNWLSDAHICSIDISTLSSLAIIDQGFLNGSSTLNSLWIGQINWKDSFSEFILEDIPTNGKIYTPNMAKGEEWKAKVSGINSWNIELI